MVKIPVYVSYSRAKEKQENTVQAMQKALDDVEFLIDTQQLQYRDNFMNFIKKIGNADYIIVVFSEAYLKSFYCMYELTKIMQAGGEIKQRVFVIRDASYSLNIESNKEAIIHYWQQVFNADIPRSEDLTQYGEKIQIEEIQEQLKNIFTEFSTTHAPTAKELVPTFDTLFDESYRAIIDWLVAVNPAKPLASKQQDSDEHFIIEVEEEITAVLEQFPVLCEKVATKLGEIGQRADELAKIMCLYEDKQQLIVPILFKVCKSAVTLTAQNHTVEIVGELKSGIRRLLNCLCILAIDAKWIMSCRSGVSHVVELPVKTSFGQVATAGRIGQVIPSLKAVGHSDLQGKHELNPFKQGAWSNGNNIVVSAILSFIYDEVFEAPERKGRCCGTEAITEEQRINLNNEIKVSAEAGSRYFYCMLRPNDVSQCFLDDPQLLQQLKDLLPALDIFKVKDTLGSTIFLLIDERVLSQTYHHFLTQLEKW